MTARPTLHQVDYQCLSATGTSVTSTWFGSGEPVEVVADWFRHTLDGYVEQAPNDWVRNRPGGTDLVVVAAAGQWPAGTPTPSRGWGEGFRTLVMQSSITSHGAPVTRPPDRRRWWHVFTGRPAR
jgi:hypothetical protein